MNEEMICKGYCNVSKNQVHFNQLLPRDKHLPFTGEFDADMDLIAATAASEQGRLTFHDTFNRENLLKRFEAGQYDTNLTFMHKTEAGSLQYLEIRFRTLMLPGQTDVQAMLTILDQSEKMMESMIVKRLAATQFDYMAIIDTVLKQITMHNIKRGVEDTNPRKSVDYDEDCRFAVEAVVVPEDRQTTLKKMALPNIIAHLDQNGTYASSFSVMTPEGDRFRKTLHYCYLDDTKRDILMSRTDDTLQYQTEQRQKRALRQALEQAQTAQKAKNEFLSRVSHDMRTPMNAITSFSRMALEENKDPAIQQYLEDMISSGDYLLNLINDLLDIQKMEHQKLTLNLEIVDLHVLSNNVVGMLTPLMAKKKIRFTTSFNANGYSIPRYCRLDAMRVQQIFTNLLSNAQKFTEPGGAIAFDITVLNYCKGTARMAFVIQDNGIGMGESFQKKMFTPFAQENSEPNSAYEGTGLGLPIVKKIVDVLGGTIACASKRGVGTRMRVELPLEMHTAGETAKQPETGDEEALRGRHILLCEDHPMNVKIIEKLVAKKEMRLTVAQNGRDGVEAFMQAPPGTFDLILMDIRMPVMDGLKATRKIRACGRPDAKKIAIIAMTANALPDDISQSRAAGMNAHLSKPVDPDAMYRVLARALQG